jgi:large subunit ribosomal protein L24
VPAQRPAPRVTKVPEIRKGDEVVVLTGKDSGKRGTVERIVRPDRLVVEGLNIAKRHTKPRSRQGRNDRAPRVQQGGILEIAQPLRASNVMLVCPACSRPTRIKHERPENGKSVRVCAHCGQPVAREVKA